MRLVRLIPLLALILAVSPAIADDKTEPQRQRRGRALPAGVSAERDLVYAELGERNQLMVSGDHLDKERGGKSDALNAGINASRYPLFCGIDGDSVIEADALLRVARPFHEEPETMVAAGGTVRIANGSELRAGTRNLEDLIAGDVLGRVQA